MKLLVALHRFWRASFLEEKAVFVVGLPLLCFFAGFEYSKSRQNMSLPIFREAKADATNTTLRVHVAGAVQKPALLTLPGHARIVDAIRQAGGATPHADTNTLNLAAPLRDGQKIVVPRRSETADRVLDVASGRSSAPIANADQNASSRVVNINTASATELETLPGIGPAIAARIVAERARKPFVSLQDIQRVNGIGPKKLQQIAPHLNF